MTSSQMLDSSEKIALSLRAIYSAYGYLPFRMNKFEEYDLYAENKNFLVSGNVITFTDPSGKLMALKPDVTLSVVKSVRDDCALTKVCYDENVYRAEKGGDEFREIMQAGLECIGDVDLYCEGEVLCLALKSLAAVCSDYLLSIGHMGYLSGVFDEACLDAPSRMCLYKHICARSKTGVAEFCRKYSVSARVTDVLLRLTGLYLPYEKAAEELKALSVNERTDAAASELEKVVAQLDPLEREKVYIDFSIESDASYYNGIIFQGFVAGAASCVLSGGRYDGLMRKFGKRGGAIGFAVYLNLLKDLTRGSREYDVDVLLLYDDTTDPRALALQADALVGSGKSVRVQKQQDSQLRYKCLMRMNGGEAQIVG